MATDPPPPDQEDAIVRLARVACAAWWGSFGGSEDPEGEWDGLDLTEREWWRGIVLAVMRS